MFGSVIGIVATLLMEGRNPAAGRGTGNLPAKNKKNAAPYRALADKVLQTEDELPCIPLN